MLMASTLTSRITGIVFDYAPTRSQTEFVEVGMVPIQNLAQHLSNNKLGAARQAKAVDGIEWRLTHDRYDFNS